MSTTLNLPNIELPSSHMIKHIVSASRGFRSFFCISHQLYRIHITNTSPTTSTNARVRATRHNAETLQHPRQENPSPRETPKEDPVATQNAMEAARSDR